MAGESSGSVGAAAASAVLASELLTRERPMRGNWWARLQILLANS